MFIFKKINIDYYIVNIVSFNFINLLIYIIRGIISPNRGGFLMQKACDKYEVFMKEILIKTIENRISTLEKNKYYQQYSPKRYIPILLFLDLTIIFILPAIAYWAGYTAIYTSTISTVFGEVNQAVFIYAITGIPLLPITIINEFYRHEDYKDRLKRKEEINSELESLKKQIIEEKENLVKLKEEKNRDNENQEYKNLQISVKSEESIFDIYDLVGQNHIAI